MPIALYEEFTGYDWETISKHFGQFMPIVCVAVSFLAYMFGHSLTVAFYTMFVGLVIALWEFPILCKLVPQSGEMRDIALNSGYVKYHLVRSALYFILSYTMFADSTICVIAGSLMCISATLYIFAYINRSSDAADGISDTDTGEERGDDQDKEDLISSRFGTF
jgi:hypothetical protein